jgi:hypothetical protein
MTTRSPNEGLYSNLYDKDMSLMRKLMNLDEFQCPGGVNSNNNNNNNNINSDATSKQFHSYPNGVFNGKMQLANPNAAANFAFPYDKQHQHMNGMRNHEGLLKPCYDFAGTSTVAKSEPLDDNFNAGFSAKKSSTTTQNSLFIPSNGNFMNQFAHHDYGNANNNNHQHPTFKMNEINNNSGGGIVVKLENGGDFNASLQNMKNEIMCSRVNGGGSVASSTMVVSKTEPNEFRGNSCKDNNNHVDNDDERKTSLHEHDSNDGFTQL